MVKYTILLTILFFTATWCAPCKKAKPIIKSLITEGYDIEIIDFDKNKDLVKKHNITSVPTLVVDGKKYPGLRTKKQYKELMQ